MSPLHLSDIPGAEPEKRTYVCAACGYTEQHGPLRSFWPTCQRSTCERYGMSMERQT